MSIVIAGAYYSNRGNSPLLRTLSLPVSKAQLNSTKRPCLICCCTEPWQLTLIGPDTVFQPINMKQSIWEANTSNNAVQSLVCIVVPSTNICKCFIFYYTIYTASYHWYNFCFLQLMLNGVCLTFNWFLHIS